MSVMPKKEDRVNRGLPFEAHQSFFPEMPRRKPAGLSGQLNPTRCAGKRV
jgi:hypothetical protein